MNKFLSFTALFFSTVGLSLIVFFLFPFYRSPKLMHGIQRIWAKTFLFFSGIKVINRMRRSNLEGPFIIMSNHQSALDIFVLLACIPFPFRFVAKRELFLIPFLGWAMRCVGHIPIKRENLKDSMRAFERAAEKIKDGLSILIFPEGTRSEDGNLLPFKRGVFHILSLSRSPILPVGIFGTGSIMPKGYFLPKNKGKVYLSIGEPLNLYDLWPREKERVIEIVRDEIQSLIDQGKRGL